MSMSVAWRWGGSLFGVGAFVGGCWVGKEYGNQLEILYLRVKTSFHHQGWLEHAISIAKSSEPYAVLSTSNPDAICTRIIEPHSIEFDEHENRHVIYFNTSSKSRKCRDMEVNPQVSLTYLDFKKLRYVTFSGKVHRVPFPESTNYWMSHLIAYYPEGNSEHSSFSTWKIIPHTISFVDFSEGIVSNRKDFRAPEIQYRDDEKKWLLVCDGRESTVDDRML